jgi:hypothetical protein
VADGGGTVDSQDKRTVDQRLAECVAGVVTLRTDIEQLKRKVVPLPKWLTIAGVVCGIVSAIATTLNGLHVYPLRNPELRAVAGQSLALAYSPKAKKLDLDWSFSIGNDGNVPNIVRNVAGEVHDLVDPTRSVIHFGPNDLDCTAGEAQIGVPFVVGQGLPKSLTCNASSYLPESGRLILGDGTSKEFTLLIEGDKQTSVTLKYCFDLPDQSVTEIRAGDQKMANRFIYPSCKSGAE